MVCLDRANQVMASFLSQYGSSRGHTTRPHISFKRVFYGQDPPVHNIQIEYADSQLSEGMDFIRSAIFPFSSTKMQNFVLLCSLAGCVCCIIFFSVEKL